MIRSRELDLKIDGFETAPNVSRPGSRAVLNSILDRRDIDGRFPLQSLGLNSALRIISSISSDGVRFSVHCKSGSSSSTPVT
jgi:hypothetical protein